MSIVPVNAMDEMLPSNRAFGLTLVLSAVLLHAAVLWSGGRPPAGLMELAGVIAMMTLLRPKWLSPVRCVLRSVLRGLRWLLQPLALALLFFGVFTPLGLALRLVGRDLLRRRLEPQALSYWIRRDPRALSAESFREQF